MTTKNSAPAKKPLSKNDRRIKREEATRLANKLLALGPKNEEDLREFSKIIQLLDDCKEGENELTSIFDLQILRNKKYSLEKMVKDYRLRETANTAEIVA